MEAERYDVTISFDEKVKKWVIDKKSLVVKRGDTIVWHLDTETSEKAYFQFPFDLLVETQGSVDVVERKTLTQGKSLILHVLDRPEVVGGRPYYYAIFVKDGFVEGENPPPKIQVGG
jgi:hypothetical protein